MTGNIRFIRFNLNASVADFHKEPKAKGKRFRVNEDNLQQKDLVIRYRMLWSTKIQDED